MKKHYHGDDSNGCDTIIVAAIFVLVVAIAMLLIGCSTQAANAAIPEKELKVDSVHDAKVINAYSALLHRIWLDKPSYVEDVLWEYDEMLELDELLNGDWENTFEFWNKQDSIEYHLNWNHVDKITKLNEEYGNGD